MDWAQVIAAALLASGTVAAAGVGFLATRFKSLQAEAEAVRKDFKGEAAAIRAELKGELNGLRQEVHALSQTMVEALVASEGTRERLRYLEGEIERLRNLLRNGGITG